MARTNDPDSATSQFYFNLVDNTFLDSPRRLKSGVRSLGAVTSGMDARCDWQPRPMRWTPATDIVIESVTVR